MGMRLKCQSATWPTVAGRLGVQPPNLEAQLTFTCCWALSSNDAELAAFCSAVGRTEWSMLLRHCYSQLRAACEDAPRP
eukprot:365688-Chlamydomonas_euryale.AAC.14